MFFRREHTDKGSGRRQSEPAGQAEVDAMISETATFLVNLCAAAEGEYDTLDSRQRELRHDHDYVDRVIRSGEKPAAELATVVAIRRIGHQLNKAGGMALMSAVATRAGDLSAQRMAERYLNGWWNRIGDWMS